MHSRIETNHINVHQSNVLAFDTFIGMCSCLMIFVFVFAVQKPREQISDAEAVMNLTSKLLGSVKGCMRRSGTSPAAFVTAILAAFGNRTPADGDAVEVDWGKLGLSATGIIREAPGVGTM